MATHSSILAWRIPWTEEPGGLYSPWGHKQSDTTEQLSLLLLLLFLSVKALGMYHDMYVICHGGGGGQLMEGNG